MGINVYEGHPPKHVVDAAVKPYFMEYDLSAKKTKYLDNVMFVFAEEQRLPISIDISSDTMTKSTFENALTEAGVNAQNVTDLKWSNSVLAIDSNAFEDMSKLSSIIGPYNSNTSIPSDLLLHMPAIQNVEIFQDAQLSVGFSLDSEAMNLVAKVAYAAAVLSSESFRNALLEQYSPYQMHQLLNDVLSQECLNRLFPIIAIDTGTTYGMLKGPSIDTQYGKLSFNDVDFGPNLAGGFIPFAADVFGGTFGSFGLGGGPPYKIHVENVDVKDDPPTITLSKPVKIKDSEGNEVEIDSELTIEVHPPEEDGPYADITIYIDLPPIVEAAGRVVAGFINAKSHSKIHLAPAIPH